jgi:hypothetical protein
MREEFRKELDNIAEYLHAVPPEAREAIGAQLVTRLIAEAPARHSDGSVFFEPQAAVT